MHTRRWHRDDDSTRRLDAARQHERYYGQDA